MRIVFDVETDGLLDVATRIHCLCYRDVDTGEGAVLRTHEDIIEFFREGDELVLIGHNIIRFDVPVLRKILGVDLTRSRKIDTLGLSWYLYPTRPSHGLEGWGNELGISKPVVTDWVGREEEEYIFRCQQDVKINAELWEYQEEYLIKLYGSPEAYRNIVGYIGFKLECAREQEEVRWKLDVKKAREGLEFLKREKEEKARALIAIMPEVIKTRYMIRPSKVFKESGELSKRGEKWYQLLQERELPEHYLGSIEIEEGRVPGNPRSHDQVKDWLFSMGWEPQNHKHIKEEDGTMRAIPQINTQDGGICPSVKALYDREPGLQHLESFFVINHRIGLMEAFLKAGGGMGEDGEFEEGEEQGTGWVQASIQGLTNTLRFQHAKPCVNLPQIVKPYGALVRGVLIAPDESHILCGSDCAGLEEATKHHFIYSHDPEYVAELRTEGFDAHLDLAVRAEFMTAEDAEFYKAHDKETASPEEKERYLRLKDIRNNKAKRTNFAAVYGAGPPKIAVTAGITLREAKALHRAYWQRNKAVNDVAKELAVRNVNGQMWLLNPLSHFWYSLRADKDRFSTLNQGTAVYCFDSWVRRVRSKGYKLTGQFHDELITVVVKGEEDKARHDLQRAMDETNAELRLNIILGIDTYFGDSYADIH